MIRILLVTVVLTSFFSCKKANSDLIVDVGEMSCNDLSNNLALLVVSMDSIEHISFYNIPELNLLSDTLQMTTVTTHLETDYESNFYIQGETLILKREWNSFWTSHGTLSYASESIDLSSLERTAIVYYDEDQFHMPYYNPYNTMSSFTSIDQRFESWNVIRDLEIVNEFRMQSDNAVKITAFSIDRVQDGGGGVVPVWHFLLAR